MNRVWLSINAAGVWVLMAGAVLVGCPSPPSTGEGSSAVPSPERPQPEVALSIGDAFNGASLRGTLVDAGEGWSELMHGCPGLTHPSGTQRIELTRPMALSISAHPHGIGMMDLTLLIRPERQGTGAPTVLCADDGHDTLNPQWSGLLDAGVYTLQVAADVATPVPYELQIALEATVRQNSLGERAPIAVTSGTPAVATELGQFGGLELVADFSSAVLEGRSGGSREATALSPDCRGWIAEQPDHVLTINEPVDVVLWTDSPGDATLVVQGPAFEHFCDDDTWGLQPVVRATLTPGEWAVFVGEYEPDEQSAYRLTVSRSTGE